ncbi:MAG: hypothetical protein V7642_4764 [Burkholderiales bacterium]|jgi:hypothetical protein
MLTRLTGDGIVSKLGCGVLLGPLLIGCTRAPSITVLGAYFPDWLFCITGAVVLTVFVHVLARRGNFSDWLNPPAIVYPTLTTGFALIAWLIFFHQ